jgi:biopolymer transport protein ExbB
MTEFLVIGFEAIRDFFERGGQVLYLISGLLVIMWFMILERIFYINGAHKKNVKSALDLWFSRDDRFSWEAHQIRNQIVSVVSMKLHGSIPLIKACVALCPLMGLLGTVTGMIDVFQVMAVNGNSNVRGMAGGVSKATIPTMAGMVAALSGLFFSFWLERTYARERELLAEHLTIDH